MGLPLSLAMWASSRAARVGPNLLRARELAKVQPDKVKKLGGEWEGHEWWEENAQCFRDALAEYGHQTEALYSAKPEVFDAPFIHPALRAARERARSRPEEADEVIRGMFVENVPGVFETDEFFTEAFCRKLLAELEHIQQSGVPLRRPNGMNRYGAILDDLGFEAALSSLAKRYIAPVATALFPELAHQSDIDTSYSFVVRYKQGEDLDLKEHADASVVTLNVCLGREFTASRLRFQPYRGTLASTEEYATERGGDLEFTRGRVILHRGQHRHEALPLETGERVNLVVWLFAEGGRVRIAPYGVGERQTPEERWRVSAKTEL